MNFLDKIIDYKKAEIEKQKGEPGFGMEKLAGLCADLPEISSFINVLEANAAKDRISLIAEVKKASPSKGIIREDFDPVNFALAYEKAGADAVSVLTDSEFFKGSIEYLKDIKKNVKIPVLRKDFIIDPFQIYQTRAMGADIILLIVAALDSSRLKDFYTLSKELGLDVLVEVHNELELELALETGARIIGVNNRNLETFEVSLDATLNLVNYTDGRFIISESGIKDYSDVVRLKNAGVAGILVGESLMRQSDIGLAVKNLMGR